MVSLLMALYLYAVGVLSVTALGLIAPAIGLTLGLIGISYAVVCANRIKLLNSQWLFLMLMTGFVFLLWADALFRSTDEIRLISAITYQFGAMLVVAFAADRISDRVFYSILLVGATLIASGIVGGNGLIGFRTGTLYGEAVNQLGIYLALAFGLGLWLSTSVSGRNRYTALLALLAFSLFSLAAIVLTGSRQSFLLALAWIPMLVVLGKVKWILVGIGIAAALLTWLSLDIHLISRLQNVLSAMQTGYAGGEGSIPARLELLRFGATAWLDAPLFGHGMRSFEKLSGFGKYSHNNYIEVLYNFGLFGFVLFYSPHVIAMIAAKRGLSGGADCRHWAALLLGLLTFRIVQDLFIVSYFRYSTWTVLLVIMLAWERMRRVITPQDRLLWLTGTSLVRGAKK